MQHAFRVAALFVLLASSPSYAQILNPVTPLDGEAPVGVSNPLHVTGSFLASLGGFTPSASGARGTPLSVTTSDSSGTLPSGVVVAVTNVGSNPMYCNVNAIAATTADQLITASGGWFAFTIPSGVTTLHCIATGGTSTANTVGGSGLPTGTGGGSGGGGGGTVAQGTGGASAWLVTGTGGTFPVTGTFWQTTQPVSVASSALALNAGVDGWSIPDGKTTDAPCTLPASATACSKIAIDKAIANAVNGPIGTGTNTIGAVGSNPSLGGAAPSSVPINVSTGTTTQLVALSGSTAIYVTSFDVIAGGTGNITFEYGTGSNCGTGTTALTGAYNLTAQAGIAKGNGAGTVLKVPSGNALCVLTSASVQMSGSVSFQQF